MNIPNELHVGWTLQYPSKVRNPLASLFFFSQFNKDFHSAQESYFHFLLIKLIQSISHWIRSDTALEGLHTSPRSYRKFNGPSCIRASPRLEFDWTNYEDLLNEMLRLRFKQPAAMLPLPKSLVCAPLSLKSGGWMAVNRKTYTQVYKIPKLAVFYHSDLGGV